MSSNSRPDQVPLYLDRNIGSKIVPSIPKSKGIPCEIHDEHLPQDAPDEDWIHLCSDRKWIAITLDSRLRQNRPAMDALNSSAAGVFVITAGNIKGDHLGALIADY